MRLAAILTHSALAAATGELKGEKKHENDRVTQKSCKSKRGGQTSSTVTLTPSTSDGLVRAPVRRLQAYVCLPLSVSLSVSTAVTQCTIAVKYRYTSTDWTSLQPLAFTYAYHKTKQNKQAKKNNKVNLNGAKKHAAGA